MLSYVIPIWLILVGIFSLSFARNKKNNKMLVEKHGEEFANKIKKYLNICGYIELICAVLWIIVV